MLHSIILPFSAFPSPSISVLEQDTLLLAVQPGVVPGNRLALPSNAEPTDKFA